MSSTEQRRRALWARFRQGVLDPDRWRHAFTHNVVLKLLSLAFAFGLWSFVNFGERDTEEALKVPLELRNIPASLVITSPRVDFIDLRVVGPRTLLGRIDRNRLSISLDLSGVRPGPAVFRVSTDPLNLPRGVRVVRINPAVVTLDLQRVARKTVPVQLQLDGEPPTGFKLVSARIAPEVVEITGPASDLKDVESIQTGPLAIGDADAGIITRELALESTGDYLSYNVSRVTAEVRIEEVQVRRELEAVAVEVRNTTEDALVSPTTVKVTVRGPKRMVGAIEADDLHVFVDAAAGEGVSRLAAEVPAPAELISIDPKTAILTIVRTTPTAAHGPPAGADNKGPGKRSSGKTAGARK
jgi:YbbR domain-containing protein